MNFQDYSSEAEQTVAGALIIKPDLYAVASGLIGSGDFVYNLNRTIYEEIGDIYAKTGICDALRLLERVCLREPTYERGEIRDYLARLTDSVPHIDNIAEYCGIIKNKSIARQARSIAHEAYEAGFYKDDGTKEAIQSAAEKLAELARDPNRRRARKLGDILHDVKADIFGNSPDLSVDTGFGTLDKMLDGIYPGDLVVIGAGTSVGKTAFALQIIKYMSGKCGKNIMLYSQEMTDRQNALRMLARESGIDMYRLKKSGRMYEGDFDKFAEAFDELVKLPVEILDNGGVSVEDIRLDCVSKKYIDVIFVDHVGLMRNSRGARTARSRNDELTQIMIDLRALALDIQKPIILLSQFNREGYKNKAEPDLGSFRDSGEVEQSASSAVLLWKLPPRQDKPDDNFIGAKVAKNRQGSTGTLYMEFDAPRMSFKEAVQYKPYKGNAYEKDIREVLGDA
jgi:replicative DNA helicase